MQHIISVLLENEPGALARAVGLFAQRGYNLESLAVAPVNDGSVSRITLATTGNDSHIEQITKQLNKLIDVIKVVDITEDSHIERELLLAKVKVHQNGHDDLRRLVEVAKGSIIELNQDLYTLEFTGESKDINHLLEALEGISNLLESVRSGVLGLNRGSNKVLSL